MLDQETGFVARVTMVDPLTQLELLHSLVKQGINYELAPLVRLNIKKTGGEITINDFTLTLDASMLHAAADSPQEIVAGLEEYLVSDHKQNVPDRTHGIQTSLNYLQLNPLKNHLERGMVEGKSYQNQLDLITEKFTALIEKLGLKVDQFPDFPLKLTVTFSATKLKDIEKSFQEVFPPSGAVLAR